LVSGEYSKWSGKYKKCFESSLISVSGYFKAPGCVSSFSYNGFTITGCILLGAQKPWCSLVSGNYPTLSGKYEYCLTTTLPSTSAPTSNNCIVHQSCSNVFCVGTMHISHVDGECTTKCCT